MVALERSLDVNAYHQYDSDFEEEVCDFLRDAGYHVDTQVGCSSKQLHLYDVGWEQHCIGYLWYPDGRSH